MPGFSAFAALPVRPQGAAICVEVGHSARSSQCSTFAVDLERDMDAAAFTERLSRLTGSEITALANVLRHEHDTVDGEVSWWRATVAVGAGLKRHHRSREAGLAAHHASAAVVQAAQEA